MPSISLRLRAESIFLKFGVFISALYRLNIMAKTKKSKSLPGPKLPKAKPVNPFTLHQNRKKFSIIGQKVKGTKGLPGISRQRAFEKVSLFKNV